MGMHGDACSLSCMGAHGAQALCPTMLACQRVEKSGKGVALLKASRLQSDLEFLEKENNVLYSDLQAKVRHLELVVAAYISSGAAVHQLQPHWSHDSQEREIQQVQAELQHQHALVDQAARNLGLPSRQLLEELYELREAVSAWPPWPRWAGGSFSFG